MNMDFSKTSGSRPALERGIGILLKYDERPPRSKRNEQFMNLLAAHHGQVTGSHDSSFS
jgi:hypothetical protein